MNRERCKDVVDRWARTAKDVTNKRGQTIPKGELCRVLGTYRGKFTLHTRRLDITISKVSRSSFVLDPQ